MAKIKSKSELKDTNNVKKKEIYKGWFLDLLDNINLPTTEYILKNLPNIKFTLVEQKIYDTYVLRKINFSSGNKIICTAINKVKKNDLVDRWLKVGPDEPFGRFFQDQNLQRIFVSKTAIGRKYLIKGSINAEIEEKFYPLS